MPTTEFQPNPQERAAIVNQLLPEGFPISKLRVHWEADRITVKMPRWQTYIDVIEISRIHDATKLDYVGDYLNVLCPFCHSEHFYFSFYGLFVTQCGGKEIDPSVPTCCPYCVPLFQTEVFDHWNIDDYDGEDDDDDEYLDDDWDDADTPDDDDDGDDIGDNWYGEEEFHS